MLPGLPLNAVNLKLNDLLIVINIFLINQSFPVDFPETKPTNKLKHMFMVLVTADTFAKRMETKQ